MADTLSRTTLRNYTKCKALLELSRAKQFSMVFTSSSAWKNTPELAYDINVNPASLRVLLPRWVKWRYIEAHSFTAEQMSDLRPHTYYKLANHGLSYLESMPKWYAYYEQAKRELDTLWNDADRNPTYRDVYPRVIFWPAYPGSKDSVVMWWPFSTGYDAGRYFGHKGQQVENINQAIRTANNLFGVRPSDECINSAIRKIKELCQQNGIKVTLR